MTADEERLALEKVRLDLDRLKFERLDAHEERKFQADRSARMWSQFATFVPILAIIVGFYANSRLESIKQANANDAAKVRMEREFVDRQLSELYYPIRIRIDKDSAVWELSRQLSSRNRATTDGRFSRYIENAVLIPNHEEIVSILVQRFGLIKNAEETYDVAPLMNAINQYQRHVAVYKTLRTLGIYRLNPIEVCKVCEFPKELTKLIDERITALEAQRASLSQLRSQQGVQREGFAAH